MRISVCMYIHVCMSILLYINTCTNDACVRCMCVSIYAIMCVRAPVCMYIRMPVTFFLTSNLLHLKFNIDNGLAAYMRAHAHQHLKLEVRY